MQTGETSGGADERQDRFGRMFEAAGIGIVITTLDGHILEANPSFLASTGYRADELEGMAFPSRTEREDRDRLRDAVAALLADDEPSTTVETRFRARDGRLLWLRSSLTLLRGTDGTATHVMGTVEDVTARHAMSWHLERSQSLLRIAGTVARIGGWQYECDTDELFWSDEICEILEFPRGVVLSMEQALRLHPDHAREQVRAAMAACQSGGTCFDLDVEVDTAAGRRLWVRSVGEAVRDADGRIVRIRGALQDIDHRKHAERERETLAERLTATLESITDAVLTLDHEWRFTYLNDRATELLRQDRRDLLGRRVWDVYPTLRGGPVERMYRRVAATGRAETLEEYHHPPLAAWFELNVYPFDRGVTVYFRDVTERREVREELQRREARMREQAELLDKAHDAIIVWGVDGRVTYCNRSAEVLYGWDAAQVRGRRVSRLLHPDPAAYDRAMAEVWAEGEWAGELHQVDRAGRELAVAARWTLVRDDAGTPQSIMAINTDVTERRRIEQHLLQKQRMESLGTLAGGMAHDLSNVLSPILMAAQMLHEEEDDAERGELLDLIEETARHGADMIHQVLAFARGVEGRRVPVSVRGRVDDVGRFVQDTFPAGIRLEQDVDDDVWTVTGDATQLHQVLVNLCVNARDAMPDGGTLTLRADNVVLEEVPVGAPAGVTPGAYVRVRVADTGRGMPPEVVERVFEPFFTTRGQGGGTGLGLSSSLGIIESHGGFVDVESAPGDGTTFTIHLPASPGEVPPEAVERPREHVDDVDPPA